MYGYYREKKHVYHFWELDEQENLYHYLIKSKKLWFPKIFQTFFKTVETFLHINLSSTLADDIQGLGKCDYLQWLLFLRIGSSLIYLA